MIDPSERLRRAIQLDSLSLVKRILASNAESQTLLRNYDEDGNTSLHLAAQLGHADIAVSTATNYICLISAEIGRNNSGQALTPWYHRHISSTSATKAPPSLAITPMSLLSCSAPKPATQLPILPQLGRSQHPVCSSSPTILLPSSSKTKTG